MADRPDVSRTAITRDKLATFLKNHELIKAFENLAKDVSETIPDAIEAATDDAGSVISADTYGRREAHIPTTMLLPSDADRVMTQAAFGPRQPTLPTSILVAGDSDRIMEQATFAPRSLPIAARDDDAGRILSGQIFGG